MVGLVLQQALSKTLPRMHLSSSDSSDTTTDEEPPPNSFGPSSLEPDDRALSKSNPDIAESAFSGFFRFAGLSGLLSCSYSLSSCFALSFGDIVPDFLSRFKSAATCFIFAKSFRAQ